MSKGNNLHNSLKRAFDDFEAPLKDAQWERLEGELGGLKKRRKWKFFPYYFSAIIIIAIVSGILSYNFIFDKSEELTSENISLDKKYNYDSEQNNPNDGVIKQQIDENKNLSENSKNSDNLKTSANLKTSVSNNKNVKKSLSKNKYLSNLPEKNNDEIKDNEPNQPTLKTEEKKPETKGNIAETKDTTSKSDVATIDENKKNEEKTEDENIEKIKEKDTDTSIIAKPDEPDKRKKSKYVISLATGYSNMNVKVTSVENMSKVHKDTRKIFEMSNKNTKTLFINFGFDCNVFKGFNIGLNTGFQYLHISQPVNIEYRMFEIPFYDINRNVIGYIKKDSATADVFRTTTTNKTSFIKIPLRFNYTIPLNLKNELLITAGTNISTIISAKGNVISINDGQVKPLSKQMFGKLNFGFLGGLQYSRQIKNQWWMGLENQWQINPEVYKNGPEKIKNRLSGYNINLILKYKI